MILMIAFKSKLLIKTYRKIEVVQSVVIKYCVIVSRFVNKMGFFLYTE